MEGAAHKNSECASMCVQQGLLVADLHLLGFLCTAGSRPEGNPSRLLQADGDPPDQQQVLLCLHDQ